VSSKSYSDDLKTVEVGIDTNFTVSRGLTD